MQERVFFRPRDSVVLEAMFIVGRISKTRRLFVASDVLFFARAQFLKNVQAPSAKSMTVLEVSWEKLILSAALGSSAGDSR